MTRPATAASDGENTELDIDYTGRNRPVATAACMRRAGPALAVQCRKDNEAEVNAFLREVRGLYPARHYRANPHGAWQGIYDSKGLVEQVWGGSWLVALPESRPYVNLPDGMFRDLYEVPA